VTGLTGQEHGQERGAAALEFALVAPMVLVIMFTVLSYGLWFNDGMNLRQGAREAARQGVVGNFGSTTSCDTTYAGTPPSTNIQKLVCQAKSSISAVTGKTYVKVVLPDGWVRGKQLLVCTLVKDTIPTIVSLPQGALIKSTSRMSIEVAVPMQAETGGQEVLPAGADWSFCA
jgi:Flp pilus assembly protein TadG